MMPCYFLVSTQTFFSFPGLFPELYDHVGERPLIRNKGYFNIGLLTVICTQGLKLFIYNNP